MLVKDRVLHMCNFYIRARTDPAISYPDLNRSRLAAPGSHLYVSDTRLLFSNSTNFTLLFRMENVYSRFINKQQQKIHLNYVKNTSKSSVSGFSSSLLAYQILRISLNIRSLVPNDIRIESNAGCLLEMFTLKIVKIQTN